MGGAWQATNATTAWTVADHEAWTSLPSARSHVLLWLAAGWLVMPMPMEAGDCGDHLACSTGGYVLLVAWFTLVFALLRGNPWVAAAAPAVVAGFLLVAEQQPVAVAVLALLSGWSLFERWLGRTGACELSGAFWLSGASAGSLR